MVELKQADKMACELLAEGLADSIRILAQQAAVRVTGSRSGVVRSVPDFDAYCRAMSEQFLSDLRRELELDN